jgi:uncharacterized DUF497 family protein
MVDIVYHLQGIEFEWDDNKARSNVQKHRTRIISARPATRVERKIYEEA